MRRLITVSMRVVPQYLDVSDVVLLFQVSALMNAGPLSVTISQRVPHWHRMSLKIHSPMVFTISVQREWYSGKCAREQWPCTKYLKLPDVRRCMVSMYILANKGTGVATTRGMRTLWVWQS